MMRKVLISLILFYSCLNAQIDISASMGLDIKNSPVLKDYINMNFAKGSNQISSFKSSVSFVPEIDYKIQRDFAIGIEYSLQIDSYSNSVGAGGIYEISYYIHRPSILAYYVVPGEGYQFKFGGGLGYRYAALTEKIFTSSNYTADGIGFLIKAEGNTLLSKNLYALIGGNLRYDSIGELSNGSYKIKNNSTGENLNLSSISFGIYLGLTFSF